MTTKHLSEAHLSTLRTALAHKRAELVATQGSTIKAERGVPDQESEAGDIAERYIEQEAALRHGAADETLLAEVDHAIAKLDAGTYGVSEGNGEPIPFDRLTALPWARLTAHEAELAAARDR